MPVRNQKVLGVIPARIGSTRIPRKMLKDICGKPLIQWTVERTKQTRLLDALVVSTDSEEIAQVVRALGVPVFMTSPELPTGTDRVAATIEQFTDFVPDIVANIWGDEPLYPPEAIDQCIERLAADDELQVVVAADLITDAKLVHEPSIVKILTDTKENVLCFSRASLPFPYQDVPFDHHHVIGVMVMRTPFLRTFLSLPQTPIERREGVEQMRILEHGYRMQAVRGNFRNLGVNTPDELEEVRRIMAQRLT